MHRLLSILTPSLVLGVLLGLTPPIAIPTSEPDLRLLQDGESNTDANPTQIKQKSTMPQTAYEYAKMCEAELGVPPKIVLDDAVEIPLYVNGVKTYGNLGRRCDNPSFLGKATVSGSTLQRHVGRTADGTLIPDVLWISFGRNSSYNHQRVIGSVQMIGYNQKTGATAFFESCDQIEPWVSLDKETLRMRGTLPGIDEPKQFNRAFVTPISRDTQCVECHQNDPFITNPFINAAKLPGTNEAVVPALDADAPYYVIGGEDWDMRTLHIRDNACFECHRVGMSTMQMFMKNGWDPNQHMPPDDPGSLNDDLQALLTVWQQGPENVEGADWVIPPAREQRGQIVGKEYPYQAHFNQPRTVYKKPMAKRSNQSKEGNERWPDKKKTDSLGNGESKAEKPTRGINDPEIQTLLNRLPDTQIRRGFIDWIKENGVDDETFEKLRAMVKEGGKGKR
ncbi:MAG: hypothetical protein MK106_14910 [Mariniblastus sp.]|nr:hypothetical protein [Mariniblastus sp.]